MSCALLHLCQHIALEVKHNMHRRISLPRLSFAIFSLLALLFMGLVGNTPAVHAQVASTGNLGSAFNQAASESGVPVSLLKALCYMEGRLSNHGGRPSIDGGYGVII